MAPTLLPFVVLARLPQATALTLLPAVATTAEQALAMAGHTLTQQGLAEAMIIGAFSDADVAALQATLDQVREQIAAAG